MLTLLGALALVVKVALVFGRFDPLENSFGIPNVNATYDYVIVSRGTRGLTIAIRLAEDANVSIAVVEAGGFY